MCLAYKGRTKAWPKLSNIQTRLSEAGKRWVGWSSTRRAVSICKLLNRLYAFRDVYFPFFAPVGVARW
jgi:hypothetical protein